MARVYEVPLSPDAQKFTIELNGTAYVLRLLWCAHAACWMLDIMDADEAMLVSSIPVVTGLDLLGQYGYLGIDGSLIAQTVADPDAVPTAENLGTDGRLYFVTR
jgi:hypothetical protein